MRLKRVAALIAILGLSGGSLPPVNDGALMAERPAADFADYRLFLDDAATRPAPRVAAYGLNMPLFSDHSDKRRFIYIPPGKTATYRPGGVLEFPVGAALIKHFGFTRADGSLDLIETRLLVRQAAGWRAFPYVWNAGDSAATLKKAGKRLAVEGRDEAGKAIALDWKVPNVNQCKGCHESAGEIIPIGPKARNLNGIFEGENNLARLTRLGLLTGYEGTAPHMPAADDEDAPLEARARAYLDVNCGHCHQPKGPASNSGMFLTYETEPGPALGIGKGPVAAGRGSGGRLVGIDPGHAERSILYYRMESTEPGVMMPELGRTQRHEAGLALVKAWIEAMD